MSIVCAGRFRGASAAAVCHATVDPQAFVEPASFRLGRGTREPSSSLPRRPATTTAVRLPAGCLACLAVTGEHRFCKQDVVRWNATGTGLCQARLDAPFVRMREEQLADRVAHRGFRATTLRTTASLVQAGEQGIDDRLEQRGSEQGGFERHGVLSRWDPCFSVTCACPYLAFTAIAGRPPEDSFRLASASSVALP